MARRSAILALLCSFAIVVLCLCGCQTDKASTSQANVEEDNLPELRIGIDTLKPFVYLDRTGDYVGIDADIATEACKRAGYKPVFVEIPWTQRADYLANGSVDCLWTAFAMDGREDSYEWTDCYLTSKEAFLVQDKSPSTCLDDFMGPNGIAVRANSKAEDLLLSDEFSSSSFIKNVHSYGSFDMAKTAFVKAYANGLVSHRIALEQVIADYPGQYRFLSDDLQTLHLGVAFGSEKTDCRNAINDALASMKNDGTLSSIASHYDPDHESVGVPDEN